MIETSRQAQAHPEQDLQLQPQRRGFLISAYYKIAAPLAAAHEPAGRRRRLLALLLLPVFLLTIIVLLTVLLLDPPRSVHWAVYIPLMVALQALFVVSYALNSAGHYQRAAVLMIAAAVAGPWAAAALDPDVLLNNPVPLAYAVVPVILCSILLSPVETSILAMGQLLVLALLATNAAAAGPVDWSGLLTLVFTTSVVSILSSIVTRVDLKQIDQQTRRLARSEAGLRELSMRDHLTGLFNRRYVEETLEREIRRSARSRHTIGLLLFDLDEFKDVNDQWGHAAGDAMLQALGHLLESHIRGGDIACRWGGDEFVIVLPEASRQATRQRAERLREAIRLMEVPYHGLSLGALTISVGLAMYPQHGVSAEALINSADQALYRAKAAGKNRVAVAEQISSAQRLG